MPAPKSPKTGFGLTTQSSLAVREARLARAYGEDRRARDAPPTARRATKDAAPPALRLNLGEEAGTVRALAPKPARKRPDRPRSPSRRSPEPASASPDRGPADAPTVTIRVLDDARNTRREFVRELKPVLREMPYFRAHLAGRVDEALFYDSGDALSDANANANANSGTAATRPRCTRDGTKRRSTSARGETFFADESHQSGKKTKNVRRVELTVHCDVEIFARLLAHVDETQKDAFLTGSDISNPSSLGRTDPEALTVRERVRVLVASEFLGMRALAESCLASLASALPEALALRPGAGVENLGDKTLARLAALVSEETLERAVAVVRGGESDAPSLAVSALPSRLYALKLRASYVGAGGTGEAPGTEGSGDRDPGPKTKRIRLSRCVSCARVFPTGAVPLLSCARAARASVAFDGRVVARHVPARRFDAAAFLDALLEAHDPRHVYWYLWGATRVLPACARCGARGIAAGELDACRYHPREAVFDFHENLHETEENDETKTTKTTKTPNDGSFIRRSELNARVGVRPCCGARAPRFDATDALANGGCCLREHAVERVIERRALKLYASFPETETVETVESVLATARRRRALVVEPPRAPFGSLKTATRAAPDANSVYRAGDHANVASLPFFLCDTLCDRVSVATTSTSPRSETRETRRAEKDFFFPRGAFGRMTETEKAETRSCSSRSSAGGSASDASDALELSSSDSDSASDAETPTTPRRRITASRAANASRRARLETETASSTLSARAELSLSELSSLETRGQRAQDSAPDGSRSVRAPRRQERPDPYRAARRARALRGRAAAAAAGTARAAKPSRLANRKPKEPASSSSTFSFGLPKDAYDALPEKLRRAVRRDALREADAARVAELERELRALRGRERGPHVSNF